MRDEEFAVGSLRLLAAGIWRLTGAGIPVAKSNMTMVI